MHEHSNMTIPEKLHRSGYDLEEEYFFHENQRAIDRLRRERQQRARQTDAHRRAPADSRSQGTRRPGRRVSWVRRALETLFRPRMRGPHYVSV